MGSASEFRRAVAARNRGIGGARRRFDDELRTQAIALAKVLRREGRTWREIADELEVSATLLQKWCRERTSRAFVRVQIDEEAGPVSSPVRLCVPGGYVVEGLDVRSAAELLRRLR